MRVVFDFITTACSRKSLIVINSAVQVLVKNLLDCQNIYSMIRKIIVQVTIEKF